MDELTVAPLRSADIPDAARVVGRAMGPTPFPMAIFRDRERSERGMETSFRIMAAKWPGSVLVATIDGRVVGALRMVAWPECQMSAGRALTMLPALLVMGSAAIRGMRGQAVWGRHDPREPHSHLGPVAVAPDLQGRGIGSKLLRRYCEMLDTAGTPAYLETDQDKNVRLYERFGFSVTAQESALGVPSWFMWRASR